MILMVRLLGKHIKQEMREDVFENNGAQNSSLGITFHHRTFVVTVVDVFMKNVQDI